MVMHNKIKQKIKIKWYAFNISVGEGSAGVYHLATVCGLCVYVYICTACLCQCDLVVSVSLKQLWEKR